jgi:Tfp pilus assembly protein PilV
MKKNRAFTFAEVLLSLFVLAISIYILTSLQFRSINKIRKSSEIIDRLFYVKKYLYKLYLTPLEKGKSIKETIENPDVTITANKAKIDVKKSSLKEFAKRAEIIWSQAEWQRGPDKRKIKMISFVTAGNPSIHPSGTRDERL